MKVTNAFSYFNGLEFLLIQRPQIWEEITEILFEIEDMNALSSLLPLKGWINCQTGKEAEQDVYFVKDRIAIDFQFGRNVFSQSFVRQLAYYVSDEIDVGVHVLPADMLQENGPDKFASLDEKTLRKMLQRGHGLPAVPLVLVSVRT